MTSGGSSTNRPPPEHGASQPPRVPENAKAIACATRTTSQLVVSRFFSGSGAELVSEPLPSFARLLTRRNHRWYLTLLVLTDPRLSRTFDDQPSDHDVFSEDVVEEGQMLAAVQPCDGLERPAAGCVPPRSRSAPRADTRFEASRTATPFCR